MARFNGGTTESFFSFDLGDGSGFKADRLKRDPRELRTARLSQNLFRAIGRPPQPAILGEMLLAPIHDGGNVRAALLVETTTGYVAYLDDLGKGDQAGTVRTTLGRPFERLAANDGNFALLPRRDPAGRTEGAYLYHASTGRALYLGGIQELTVEPSVVEVEGVPALTGRVATAEILAARGETLGFVVIDGGNGELRFLDVSPTNPGRLVARASTVNLFDAFARQPPRPTPARFVAAGVEDREGTANVFLVDVSSGALASLVGVRGDAEPTLRPYPQSLASSLRSGDGRVLVAVPHLDNGRTVGVWLIDNLSGTVLYIGGLDSPGAVTVSMTRRTAG